MRVGGYLAAQVTEKLDPSLDSADGMASFMPLFSIVISSIVENDEIGPCVELSFALFVPAILVLSLPKSTVPKSARGRISPSEGASAIHSAEVRAAPETAALLLKDCPLRSSVIFTVNFPVLAL